MNEPVLIVKLTSGGTIQPVITGGSTIQPVLSGGVAILPVATADTLGGIKVGENLKIESGMLSVDTATAVEEDNTRPVTAAAVHTEIGNIEVLLSII